jgi:uncharacterized membrane protein YqaE (UPF0057 family)
MLNKSRALFTHDYSEGILIYKIRIKIQAIQYSNSEEIQDDDYALLVVSLSIKFYLFHKKEIDMDIRRLLLAVILPPAAIMNKEAGTIMLTGLLTLLGWLPGVVFALFLISQEQCKCEAKA